MSKSFPLNVKPSKVGRPRQDRARYPSGEVKPPGPTPELLAHRRSISADPSMGENPLDAAFARGWLSLEEHRTGHVFASIHRQAGLGGPRVAVANMGEVVRGEDPELLGVSIKGMSDEEIARIWDQVFGLEAAADEGEREDRAVLAMAKWRALNAAMTAAERDQVVLICVIESWPQWFVQRCAGEAVRERAIAERRALSDGEQELIAKRFSSPWERKRDLLVSGLRAIARAMKAARAPAPEHRIVSVPAPERQIGPVVVEVANHVDPEGRLLYTVERRRRRQQPIELSAATPSTIEE